jgi:hypothetical protein
MAPGKKGTRAAKYLLWEPQSPIPVFRIYRGLRGSGKIQPEAVGMAVWMGLLYFFKKSLIQVYFLNLR